MGIICAIAAMIFFSAANITIYRGADYSTRGGGVFLSIIITLILSFSIWTILGVRNGFSVISFSAVAWFSLAGVITIFVGRTFLYVSIQRLGAVRASAVKRLNPFFTVILGVFLLGEPLGWPMMLGMALIFTSFTVLVAHAIKTNQSKWPAQKAANRKLSLLHAMVNLGYLYGPISAFAYAAGYVLRKQGLLILPDAIFGSMIGSLAGAAAYIMASKFVYSYRIDMRNTFSVFNPWLFSAGILSSLGQITYFVALNYMPVSQAALIGSLEVFLTIVLSICIFRTKEQLTIGLIFAVFLGTLGGVIVILY